MSLKFCFLFLLISSVLSAQKINNLSLRETDTLPEKFRLPVSELREHIYQGIPDNYKNSIEKRRLYHFADFNAVGISELVSSGDVYENWPELESYLNQILRKVMPEEIKSDSGIHAYVTKNPEFNAFMTPSGLTFINVGLLTYLSDEASLASVLAHELAHYYKRHSLKTFIKEEQGNFKEGLFIRNNSESEYSIFNEAQADSLSLKWLMDAGYELNGSGKAFGIMKNLQEGALQRSQRRWEIKASTHPLPQQRLEYFVDFIQSNPDYKGEKYLFGEDKFRRFQDLARKEVLKQELEKFHYSSCIEKAFKFHLLDPGNIVYQEYILEGIRRACYIDPSLWNQNFVTHRYYDPNAERKSKYAAKPQYTKCLFESEDSIYLGISPEEHEKIRVMAYWEAETPIFRTNEGAFLFFYKIARQFGSKEAILSNALSVTLDTAVRNDLLREYISFSDIQYGDYARSLLKQDATENLPKKTIFVLSSFNLFLVEGKEQISIRSEKEKDFRLLRAFMDTVNKNYEDSPLIHLEDLNYNKLQDYRELVDLAAFAERRMLSKGQRLQFDILEPRFWNFFKKFEASEFKFLELNFVETRKSKKTISEYNSILNIDFTEFFKEKKRTRELYLSVNSIRLDRERMMKIRYFEIESLRFKGSAMEQLVPLIIENLDEDLKAAENKDRIYRILLEEEE